MLSRSAASSLLLRLQSENERLKQMRGAANDHQFGTQFTATTEKNYSGYESALDVTQPRPEMQTYRPEESPNQPKAISQRQYREREGELFNELRTSIARLTNQEPGTRLEILTQGGFCSFATE